MKLLVVIAAALVLATGLLAAVLTADGDRPFTAARAEELVRRALERCGHELADARRIVCVRAGRGWACRADGRYVASFNRPSPDERELEVTC